MWTECERFLVRSADGRVHHAMAGEHIAEMGFGECSVRIAGYFLIDEGIALRRRDADHYEIQRTGEILTRVNASMAEIAA